MDKIEYGDAVSTKLNKCNFFELRKDLKPDSIKRVYPTLKETRKIFKDIINFKFLIPS